MRNFSYINKGSVVGGLVQDDHQNVGFTNSLVDKHGDYIPFTRNVYNIEVADNHTYFVGLNNIWVHNTDCDKKTQEALAGIDFKPTELDDIVDSKGIFPKVMTHLIETEKNFNKVREKAFAIVKSVHDLIPKGGFYKNGNIEKTGQQLWKRIQQLYLGSSTKYSTADTNILSVNSGGEMVEISVGGINILRGKSEAKAIADVVQTMSVEKGVVKYSNMVTDVKAGYGTIVSLRPSPLLHP